MKDDRVLRTIVGSYKETEWWGHNTAGFDPVGDMVLVLPDEAVTVSPGGIIMPDTVTETNSMAAESGTIVAIGTDCFSFTSLGHNWVGAKPQVGDRVRMQRYSGQMQAGRDGHAYRLMTYTCIGAVEQPRDEGEDRRNKLMAGYRITHEEFMDFNLSEPELRARGFLRSRLDDSWSRPSPANDPAMLPSLGDVVESIGTFDAEATMAAR